jgi:putative Holliday junction resolvase
MAPPSGAAPHLILAFDFGTRRIGIASGDTLTRTSRGLKTLDRLQAIPWTQIDALIADYRPAQFVVGLPYNMDGTPTSLSAASRHFAAALKARYGLPVALVDERLSSREAEAQLRYERAQGLKRRRTTHADVDMTAAGILLQRWFADPAAAEDI